MNDTVGPDTIFYTLKLKRTRGPMEVFEKMIKSIKKKGVTKNWTYEIDKDIFTVDFGDGMSECFLVQFDENNICKGICKVYFPNSGEFFDDEKKSEFKTLLNMILSAKSMFSKIDITDDYGIAADYVESKKYKLQLRELTASELSLAHELYDTEGSTDYCDFIIGVIRKALFIPMNVDPLNYLNEHIVCKNPKPNEKMFPLFETYLYETSAYKGKRLCEYSELEYETDTPGFTAMAFILAANELYCYRDFYTLGNNVVPLMRYTQIHSFYRDKVFPTLDTMPDCFEKCCIAYRFFLSAYDFCGFKYLGKEKAK